MMVRGAGRRGGGDLYLVLMCCGLIHLPSARHGFDPLQRCWVQPTISEATRRLGSESDAAVHTSAFELHATHGMLSQHSLQPYATTQLALASRQTVGFRKRLYTED